MKQMLISSLIVICVFLTVPVLAQDFNVSETVETALLRGQWQKVFKQIKADSAKVDDPVSRLLMAHACLATSQNYGASKLFTTVVEPEEVEQYFGFADKLAKANPTNAIAVYFLADANLRKENYDAAIDGFTKAIELNQMLTVAYYQRGNTYERALKNNSNAIADYKSAIQINPRFARAYLNLGNVFHDRGDLDKALGFYGDAIKADSQYSQAFFNRGNIYFEQGEHDKSILEYDQAIQIRPIWAEAYYNRGNVYLFGKEEWVNAIFEFDKAIKFNTSHVRAICNRGVARSRNGEYAQAIGDFNRVLQLKEDDAEAFSNRGNAWVQMGEYEKALSDYNRAIHFDNRLAEAYENRGFLYMVHMSDKDKACADWSKACDLGRCANYKLAQKNGDCE